jgi:phosphopantothenoylcysteine decarboxylase
MNTFMYEHPLTAEHVRVVRDIIKYNVVGPIGKNLACGDIGKNALTGSSRSLSSDSRVGRYD